ncbi:Methyl-accepting chemotaxis protein [Pseudoxanthobacter soli DSM 19599]|uniref:Methyl-accepting chemotaxis protein n=1 Tax=Pseudoxanthobacter soli DSM 19599 TaxID=1123029 RepID=A0A1M7ZJ40_9HYPH|nr:methyl-accepting chemotaxis protein [Pseudoxanthobacter soli]SHO64904.1 Methyl-accepting chemotaxis protein [Pseudoxanthobacter soli DSM 19599]
MRFNIGVKLGLSAAVGVLLAGGLIAAQIKAGQDVEAASEAARAQSEILTLALRATTAVRKLESNTKDMLLSYKLSDINDLSGTIPIDVGAAKIDLSRAVKLTQLPENAKRLRDLSDDITRYGTAAEEIATEHMAAVVKLKELSDLSAAWDKLYRSAKPDLATGGEAAVGAIRTVDGYFRGSSGAVWRFVATGDKGSLASVDFAVKGNRVTLSNVRSAVSATKAADRITEFEKIFDDYDKVLRELIVHQDAKTKIAREQAEPAAAAALGLAEAAVSVARERSVTATKAADAAIARSTSLLLALTGGLILVLLGSALYAAFWIARPIALITKAMEKIAKGDLATPIPYEKRSDELGEQAHVLAIFRDDLAETERMREEQARLEAEMAEQRKRDMHELANRFEGAVGEIVEMVSSAAAELEAAAQTLTATAEETTAQAAAVAAAAEQAATNVQTVAAAVEELASSSAEIGNQVSYSTSVTAQAVSEADSTNSRMGGLKSAAEQVGAIVGMIGDIAAQTNLLALNATIESARAGEAGRGFAVVAQEVKSLAEQTSKATSQISGQISGIQGSTGEAVTAITSVGRTISEINQVAAAIGAAVEQQNATTAEIARNVQQAAQGTQEVTRNITGVTQAAQASSSASVQVLSSAGKLNRQASNLRLEVENFLTTVRAA